jgi:hypothetical protein
MEMAGIIIAWNSLHETLARLFCAALGTDNPSVPLAVWHSLKSDRTQRDALRAALNQGFLTTKNCLAVREKTKLLLNEIHKLADRRNDAIHSPFVLRTDQYGTVFTPDDTFANPRAQKLSANELLSELVWYREQIEHLDNFAFDLYWASAFPRLGWPLPDKLHMTTRKPKSSGSSPQRPNKSDSVSA